MIISIITICLNDKEALIKTRKSVEYQLCHDYEHIIVDGASADGTLEYLNTLDETVKWISEPDYGISDAFNKGLELSTGDIILCLNAGDSLYDENVIGDVISDWKKYEVDILSYMVEKADGQVMWCRNEEFWEKGFHAHQGVFLSRKAYKKLGGYNIFLKSKMDYDLFLRMSKMNLSHRLIDRIVARFDTNGISQYDTKLSEIEGVGLRLIYEKTVSIDDINKIRIYAGKDIDNKKKYVDDKEMKYTLIHNWIDKLLSGKSVRQYLGDCGIKRVSIYGAGQIGALLVKDLTGAPGITIVELIDAIENKRIGKMTSITLENMSMDVDVVIVTVVNDHKSLCNRIKEDKDVEVLSLKDIISKL